MVIATGSRMVLEEIPGMKEGAEFFYTEESAVKLFRRLRVPGRTVSRSRPVCLPCARSHLSS